MEHRELEEKLAKLQAQGAHRQGSLVSIVTPKRRLARQLQENFLNDREVIYEYRIQTLDEWLLEQSRPLLSAETKLPLSGAQEYLMWNETLTETTIAKLTELNVFADESRALRQRMIAQASDAWRLINLYQIEASPENFAKNEIHKLFYAWLQKYRELCDKRGLLDRFMLWEKLGLALAEGNLSPPPSLWVGFTEPIPLYENLYSKLRKQTGVIVDRQDKLISAPSQNDGNDRSDIFICEYENERDELAKLAVQVKQTHVENPDKQIAVVIPGMESNWPHIRRLFVDLFSSTGEEGRGKEAQGKQRSRYAMDQADMPFDMSWGESLKDFPLIGDLLNLLHLVPDERPPADFVEWVNFSSPYLAGHKSEADARADISDKLLYLQKRYAGISLAKLSQSNIPKNAKPTSPSGLFAATPQIKKQLHEYFAVKDAFAEMARPSHWAEVFSAQIKALGWGDLSQMSRLEPQLWDRINGLLDSLHRTESVTENLSRGEALEFLEREAEGIFQLSPPDTKIKILGMNESEGLLFDYLFACRMNTTCVPQPAVNFFIPFNLTAKIYGDAGRREREERLLNHLLIAAPQVRISFAAISDDEEKLCHSLLADIKHERVPFITEEMEKPAVSFESPRKDDMAPKVGDEENLSGIVSILKSYSNCPFQATVRQRFKPHSPGVMEEELSAADRGNMLHDIARVLWEDLKDSKNLAKKSTAELNKMIAKSIDAVLTEQRSVFLHDDFAQELEGKMFTDLLEKLMEAEKMRRLDYTPVFLEEAKKIKFGKREFEIKIDRVDRLEKGGEVLMDYKYKRSPARLSPKRDMRPAEPQLVVYSMLLEKIVSLGFVNLQQKYGCSVDGIFIEDDGFFSDYKESKKGGISREQLEKMQEDLGQLYKDFIAGNSQVDPRNAQSCEYCDYPSICRVKEGLK